MKQLIVILTLPFLSLSGCGECNDCGPLRPFEYGVINNLNDEVKLEFYGNIESNSEFKKFELVLSPSDTSELWVTILDPVSDSDFSFLFKPILSNSSFHFFADSISVKSRGILISTFRRQKDELEQDFTSIFFGGIYIQSDLETEYELNPILYPLDSVNLKLK